MAIILSNLNRFTFFHWKIPWYICSKPVISDFFKSVNIWQSYKQESCYTDRFSNKPFLLTTLPHLKYVATLPYNLSLMACFADINVSQRSVATYARRGGVFNISLTTNLPKNLPVKKRFLIDSDLTELWSRVCGLTCFGPPCMHVAHMRCTV